MPIIRQICPKCNKPAQLGTRVGYREEPLCGECHQERIKGTTRQGNKTNLCNLYAWKNWQTTRPLVLDPADLIEQLITPEDREIYNFAASKLLKDEHPDYTLMEARERFGKLLEHDKERLLRKAKVATLTQEINCLDVVEWPKQDRDTLRRNLLYGWCTDTVVTQQWIQFLDSL